MGYANSLLDTLDPNDIALLADHLIPVGLAYRQMLVRNRCYPEHIYFPEQGLVTVFAMSKHRDVADVGMIGNEGCTAIEVVLGSDRANCNAVVQIGGRGHRVATSVLIKLSNQSPTLKEALLRYACLSLIQARETALANARATIFQRAARWILMAGRSTRQNELHVTHEILSMSLGVRRAGITTALRRLADIGLIEPRRGHIYILDTEGLLRAARGYCSFNDGLPQLGAAGIPPACTAPAFR